MSYAEKTKVAPSQTKADIERLVERYGATAFGTGQDGKTALVFFRLNERMIRFKRELPDDDPKARARWRARLLVVKAKLESAATGITTIEDEFLAHTVMSDGKTVSEAIQPQIEENYRVGGPPRLLLGAA